MGDYLLTVATVSCTIGILEYLFYPSRPKEAAVICASVILVHAILAPALSFAASLPDTLPQFELNGSFDIPYDDAYEKTAEDAFKEGICKLLCTKYDLKHENIYVSVEGFNFSEMKAKHITVILSGAAALSDCRGMEEYLKGLSLGECEVKIRIG